MPDAQKTVVKTTGPPSLVGSQATSDTTTPTTAGYHYYWVEVTNNRDIDSDGVIGAGETATVESAFPLVKVVDRSLPPALVNGDFTYWAGYPAGSDANGAYPAKTGQLAGRLWWSFYRWCAGWV